MSWRTILEKLVKTRKEHRCWGCTKRFPIGATLLNVVGKDDEIMSVYWCGSCQKLTELDNNSDGEEYGFGELIAHADDIIEAHRLREQSTAKVAEVSGIKQ